MSKPAIPVFDLDSPIEPGDILAACGEVGCFNIRGGSITPQKTQALLARMDAFFSLADDDPVKQACHRDRNHGANGWTPSMEEPAYEANTIAWVESFDCVLANERLAQVPEHLRCGVRPSIWPRIGGFRDTVRDHWDAMIETAAAVFPLISQILGQESGFLASKASSQVLNTMRLLNYPPNPAPADGVNQGISAHTDFECITLIHQTAPGLEVKSPQGNWIRAPVEAGQWTVLIGEMVEHWSNGQVRATPHRVPPTAWPRKSIVMFLAADPGVQVGPLAAFVDNDHPPGYATVTQDKVIREAMARAEANRAAMADQIASLKRQISPG